MCIRDRAKRYEPYNFNLYSKSAHKILHLIASDEYRWSFPLSNISGAGGMHQEWMMIGVHSDIGGGYGVDFMNEGIDKQNLVAEKYFLGNESKEMKRYREKAESEGNFVETSKSKANVLPGINSVYVVTVYSKRDIHPELHIVALHILHQQALKYAVPFEDLPCSPEFQVPEELEEYRDYAVNHPSQVMSYDGELTPAEIREQYVHRSHGNSVSRDGWVKSVSESPLRKRWWKPGEYERTVFDNEPAKAIRKPG